VVGILLALAVIIALFRVIFMGRRKEMQMRKFLAYAIVIAILFLLLVMVFTACWPTPPPPSPPPPPVPTPSPTISRRTIFVANTDGDGVVLRYAPLMDARTGVVFPEGQPLTMVDQVNGWAHIVAPAEGYIPPQYWNNSPPAPPSCPTGCPEHKPGCDIKGNVSYTTGEKVYHVPGGTWYDATVIDPRYGERWFCTEAEAVANGWRRSSE
jgi:hypothetical protein